MRRRTGRRAVKANKGQSQACEIFDTVVEVKDYVRDGNKVTITFGTIADAMDYVGALEISMQVDKELENYEEDPMEGVKRTLKV